MANKQPEVTGATRARIVSAFWDLYAHRPLSQITIKEVAAKAGVHRVTFYEYFENLESLLDCEEQAIIESVSEEASAACVEEPSLAKIAAVYAKHGDKICVLMGPTGDPSFTHRFKATSLPVFERSKGIEDSPEAKIAFEFGASGLLAAFNWWHENRKSVPLETFVATMRSLVQSGIMPTAS